MDSAANALQTATFNIRGTKTAYDANGNMQTGRGSTLTWTSYNAVASITQGSLSSQFSYGPNRNYSKLVATYADGTSTTLYVGGILEKVTNSGVDDYRHMIRTGGATVIVSRASNGSNNVYYATQDHLGSSAATTNSSGAIILNASFGAFGSRRASNWQGTPSTADWTAIASTSRRGFTDHTMLDNVGLIHMNGRVYDPAIGRFASADPYIDCAMNTQGWNRFSYVKNNPLSATDPSGYVAGAPGWKNIQVDPVTAPLEEILLTASRGTGSFDQYARSIFPSPTPSPSGPREGAGGGSAAGTVEEVVVTGIKLKIPPILPINFQLLSYPLNANSFRISVADLGAMMTSISTYENCMENCMKFAKDGLIDPIAEVAGGLADGGLPGGLAGAIGAYGSSTPFGMAGDAVGGFAEGAADGRATFRSTVRRGQSGALGSFAGSFVNGLTPQTSILGSTVSGFVDSYARTRWNNSSRATSVAAGIKGAKSGIRGAVVSYATRAVGGMIAERVCDTAVCGK